MAVPKQTQEQVEALVASICQNVTEPEFCSLDEVVNLPAEHSDPFFIVMKEEERSGIPMAFQREVDEVIRVARRNLLL
jgi:hypothetical protein